MRDILKEIVAEKHREVALKKMVVPGKQLEKSELFSRETLSMKESLLTCPGGIIAEHKRRSPSKAVINQQLSVEEVVQGYEKAHAGGISVLTDGRYFGGSLEDLLIARASVNLPLLRKEFIIDEYQILEAKAFGADVILLIAAILSRDQIQLFTQLTKSLGMEVLLEVHSEEEYETSVIPGLDMIGVNNRNLKTFEVDLNTSKTLAGKISPEFTRISESGINSPESIRDLQTFGYKGFLIGELFMKTDNPGASAKIFINHFRQ